MVDVDVVVDHYCQGYRGNIEGLDLIILSRTRIEPRYWLMSF